jgi:uncharacterized membrane protein
MHNCFYFNRINPHPGPEDKETTMLSLLRGWPGKPSHPPLTDASIGAYTAGAAMLLAGRIGIESEQMAVGSLIAISVGLLLAAPTALTGLLDWLQLPRGTPARAVATYHLLIMVTATALFALTWLAQRPGYNDDEVRLGALMLGLGAETVLAVGGYLGGTIVFVYGNRVLNRPDVSVADALVPGRADHAAPPGEVPGRSAD